MPCSRIGRVLAIVCLSFCVSVVAAQTTPVKDSPSVKKHPVLSPTEALKTFRLPEGFEIQLVAAEPDLVNPMTMTLDEQGRIYISSAHTYRYGAKGSPVDKPSNPVIRLELNANGRVADRTEVGAGFANPVMGLAVRQNRIWATNLNRVFTAKLDKNGRAGNQKTIVQDAETPWNPFGMYRIAFGPDGWLYLCVGDHPTKLTGPNNKVTVRGNTGAIFRFKPDGSQIETLVQGMRAPFAFDIDPFGRMWVLSNGEGNPNRLIHAIPGGDYHFQTRAVDWSWLAGKHPLAPPVWENPPGAHTAVLAYYSSAFPKEYWGNLLVSNWGKHGFPSAHHVILRHRLDERGELVKTEPFLTTTDPRFRPTQIAIAPDGNLYVLDWYGMDDENDLTGRLYKVIYVGNKPTARLASTNTGLASSNRSTRHRTRQKLLASGADASKKLAQHLAQPDALAASEALWTLRQSTLPDASTIMEKGLEHPDWRVRRLAIQLLHEQNAFSAKIEHLLDDPDPAVKLEAAIASPSEKTRVKAVANSLRAGVAKSRRLRYRAALAIARHGEATDFESLLMDRDYEVRLAGLIALDEAFHEGMRVDAARKGLAAMISNPRGAPLVELLALGQRWPHASLHQPVTVALKRDVSADEFLRCVSILRSLGASPTKDSHRGLLGRFWKRVAKGDVQLASHNEKLGALEILAMDQPAAETVAVLSQLVRDKHQEVRAEAHRVLTTIGPGNAVCIGLCWNLIGDSDLSMEYRLETIVSLSQIEKKLSTVAWSKLLDSASRKLSLVAVRCLRNHTDQAAVARLFDATASRLATRGPDFAAALKLRQKTNALSPGSQPILTQMHSAKEDPQAKRRKETLRKKLLKRPTDGDALLGRLVFRNQICHHCHQPRGQASFAGPPLKGVASANPVEYLVDSILYPSKAIKTGFMQELIVTQQGRTLVGGVARQGDELIVTSTSGISERIKLADVEERRRLNRSLMPDSLEMTMSEPELLDLIAYLTTLREQPKP